MIRPIDVNMVMMLSGVGARDCSSLRLVLLLKRASSSEFLIYSHFPQFVSPQIVSFAKIFENAQLVSFKFLIKRRLKYYVFSVHL